MRALGAAVLAGTTFRWQRTGLDLPPALFWSIGMDWGPLEWIGVHLEWIGVHLEWIAWLKQVPLKRKPKLVAKWLWNWSPELICGAQIIAERA